MRIIIALGIVGLLTGCVTIPPAVTLASWALSGFSFVVTGKTVSDHAISSIAEEDCSVLRVLQNKPVCHAYAVGEGPVLVAYAGPDAYPGGIDDRGAFDRPIDASEPGPTMLAGDLPDLMAASGPEPEVAPARTIAKAGAASGSEIDDTDAGPRPQTETFYTLWTWEPADAEPPVTADLSADRVGPRPVVDGTDMDEVGLSRAAPVPEARYYVVIGSFTNADYAAERVAKYPGLAPDILPADIDGRHFRRVVVGPFGRGDIEQARQRIRAVGITGAWPLRAPSETATRPLALLQLAD